MLTTKTITRSGKELRLFNFSPSHMETPEIFAPSAKANPPPKNKLYTVIIKRQKIDKLFHKNTQKE